MESAGAPSGFQLKNKYLLSALQLEQHCLQKAGQTAGVLAYSGFEK
jgi:hypothetical protein